MVIQFPCGICSKAVANNHQAIKCDQCNLWIHIKCNKINKQTYNHLKSDSPHWFSISCTKQFLSRFSNTPKSIRENFIQAHSENNSSWQLSLNDLTALSCDKKNNLSVFHLNMNSLQYHFPHIKANQY